MAEMSPLRRRMIEDMTIRNLSPATQQSYLYAVSKFSRHFGHSPDRLGSKTCVPILVHLTSKGFAWSSLNQTVCGLRFFYGVTLGQSTIVDRIPFAREPQKLPTVLSAEEVVRFLEAVSSLKARVALTTAYAAGLRVLRKSPRSRSATSTAVAWCCGSNAARAARSATPCSPTRCSASCASIGDWRGRGRSCFPVGRPTRRSSRACCMPLADWRRPRGRARQACERVSLSTQSDGFSAVFDHGI